MSRKCFIVTGASGGIGSAVCRDLTARGDQVLLAGRNERSLQALSDELDQPYLIADATEVNGFCESISEAVASMSASVEGIVNCAGSLLLKPAHLTTVAEWEAVLAANLTSAFASVRAGFQLLRRGGGSIVLMASAAAATGLPNHEAIAAAKAGVVGLMRSAAATYASRGIRVNAVAPGLVETPMTESIWAIPKAAEFSKAMHPLGRLGKPSDVSSLICWLLSAHNDWITGQVFGVDGGLAALKPARR